MPEEVFLSAERLNITDLPSLITHHLDWLEVQNRIHNLTRVPRDQWITRHVLDSLIPVLAGMSAGQRIIDLGTGGGFPGIPLASMFPSSSVHLLDTKQKVIELLHSFITQCGCTAHIYPVCNRAEILGHLPEFRESFDLVVSRAVASLPVLMELSIPLIKTTGECWFWKNDLQEVEVAEKALLVLEAEFIKSIGYRLPGENQDRHILIFKKSGKTDQKYPRKAGIPQKRPL